MDIIESGFKDRKSMKDTMDEFYKTPQFSWAKVHQSKVNKEKKLDYIT